MEKGLSSQTAIENLRAFGKNEIQTQEVNSFLSILISQFPTIINGILAIAAIFSFVIKDYFDCLFILAVLLLNGFLGFIQEYRAEKSLEKLKSFIKPTSRVVRDGKEIQVLTSEIVPQDLVMLCEGERIPADGKLIVSKHIEVDESILTGESLPLVKEKGSEVFKGTLVIKGRGYFVVEKTGSLTKFGQIAKSLASIETDLTPLQKRLSSLGKSLSIVVLVVSLLLIPIGVLQDRQLFPLILLAISIGIAAIPEGLPAVVTIALAIGTNRMAKKHAIIRKMPAIETLGSVQIVLVDKTGTLTKNSMQVKNSWLNGKESLDSILKACVLGNTASLVEKENTPPSSEAGKDYDVVGDKTDGALLMWAKNQIDFDSLDRTGKIIDEYVFDPVTKTITTLWQQDGKEYVFVRGAPETIFEKSKLEKQEKNKVRLEFENFAKQGLRVIGFGSKNWTHDGAYKREHLESDLDFLGFVGIYDAPREEVKQAIATARRAGIKTIMVTGDNELTALAIAKEVGLVEKDEDVLTGVTLDKMSDDELEKVISNVNIFARTKPEDKLRLTNLYKKLGFVVGVTGDGVNDALALKRADVGVAMGQKGTDVAKEASDIILADDNFSTLVHAISEGRTIYSNIVKAITYLLSGNLSEISLVFFAIVLGLPNPLIPVQILWINLVTDTLPGIALASDTKNPKVLSFSPRNPKEQILTKNRLLFITVVGFGISLILLFTFKLLLNNHSEIFARTIVFNLLIFMHMIIAFIVRGRSIFSANKLLIVVVLGTLALQIIITTIPVFQQIFHLGI